MKKIFLFAFALALSALTTTAWAQTLTYDFAEENEYGTTIYYTVTTADETEGVYEVEVAGEERGTSLHKVSYYTGHVVIPDEVYWGGGWGNTSENYWTQFPAATYKVTGVGAYAFAYCEGLTEVTIGANVRSLGYSHGENVIIGATCTCFVECTELERVNFSSAGQLTYIGDECFGYCSALRSIVVPEGVDTIGINAFLGCSALRKVALPTTLTTLDNLAFRSCTTLGSITLPAAVDYVGYMAFAECTALRRVVMLGSTPPYIDEDEYFLMFGDDTQGVNIYVPTAALEAYTSTYWGNLINSTLVPYASTLSLTLAITDGTPLSDRTTAGSTADDDTTADDGTTGLAFSTLYVGEYDTLLPSTLTAYIVSEVNADGELILTQLTDDTTFPADDTSSSADDTSSSADDTSSSMGGGGTIPAATAALVAGDLGTYSDLILVSPETDSTSANLLYGSDTDNTLTTVTIGVNAILNADDSDYYFYKLTTNAQGDTDSAGFYWGAADGSAFYMPAGKAWLAVPRSVFDADGVKGLKMKFPKADNPNVDDPDGNLTGADSDGSGSSDGISSVGTSVAPIREGIYTLQGVRVANVRQPGVYVVNGRKVIKR